MFALLPFAAALALSPTKEPVSWSVSSTWVGNGEVQIQLTAVVEAGWHFYATELPSDLGPIPTSFRFTPSTSYTTLGPVKGPSPVEEYDENFGMMVRHHSGKPTFILRIEPLEQGPFEVECEVEYMACNNKTCLPPVAVPFKVRVEARNP